MTPTAKIDLQLKAHPQAGQSTPDDQSQLDFYRPSIALIRQTQCPDGAIGWFKNGPLDPWDMVEAAMGLAVAGDFEAAQGAYAWLAREQLPDGSLWNLYTNDHKSDQPQADRRYRAVPQRRETHHAAYMAVGLWHLHLCTGSPTLGPHWPAAVRGLEFALSLQSEHGDILWALDTRDQPLDDALVTACSNLCKSLECGIAGELLCGRERPEWRHALRRLRHALRHRGWRFDRHWQSKRRYSMDWFYPVLGGVFVGEDGRQRLQRRWQEFVQPGMGCRCVSDQPWATVAESCELVMALCAVDLPGKAAELLSWLHRHRDERGQYWTGYVWPDDAFWPVEQPSWTAAAALLAADSLYGFTPASGVLTRAQTADR